MQACLLHHHISPLLGIWERRERLRSVKCRALPISLESALSRRTDKKLLRDICIDAFQQQEQERKLEAQLAEEKFRGAEEKFGRLNERLENLLKMRTADLLFTKGLLNVTGVLEYLEDDCRETRVLQNPNDRQEIWTHILQETANQDLKKCLVRANDKLKRKSSKPLKLEEDISEMYHFASNSVHGKLSPVYMENYPLSCTEI